MEIKESTINIELSLEDISEAITLFLQSKGYSAQKVDFTLKQIPNKIDRFSNSWSLDKCICQCGKI